MRKRSQPLAAVAVLFSLWAATRLAQSKPQPGGGDLVTVTVRATISAQTQFKDGEVSENEAATVSYSETAVRRIVPINDSSVEIKPVSYSGLVEASGRGKMVWGQGLPVSEWTFECRQPGQSLLRLALKADRLSGAVGLENFLAYRSLSVKCSGGDPEQWRPKAEASGLIQEAWSGFCQAKSVNLPSLALPFKLDADGRSASLNHVYEVNGQNGRGKLTLVCTIRVGPGEGRQPLPKLRANPQVASSVVRGEPLILDGSRSTGNIQSYQWTFLPGDSFTGLTPPRSEAHKEGDVSRVVLLDSMRVKLTVSDGQTSDSKTVSVKVVPRQTFHTSVQHHEELQVASWDNAPMPLPSNLAEATFKNDCEPDPNQPLGHVIHPDLDKAKAEDYCSLVPLEDPGGPFDGYSYFEEWKVKVRRKTMVNKWLLPEAPPVVAGMANWYSQNGKSIGMYYLRRADRAARAQTDRVKNYLSNQEANSSPASWAEKTYAADASQLKQQLMNKLVEFEAELRSRIREKTNVDAPAVQVWDPDSGKWKKVQVTF